MREAIQCVTYVLTIKILSSGKQKILLALIGNFVYTISCESEKTRYADMAELADAHGSGPCEYCFRGGSNPLIRTKQGRP